MDRLRTFKKNMLQELGWAWIDCGRFTNYCCIHAPRTREKKIEVDPRFISTTTLMQSSMKPAFAHWFSTPLNRFGRSGTFISIALLKLWRVASASPAFRALAKKTARKNKHTANNDCNILALIRVIMSWRGFCRPKARETHGNNRDGGHLMDRPVSSSSRTFSVMPQTRMRRQQLFTTFLPHHRRRFHSTVQPEALVPRTPHSRRPAHSQHGTSTF